MKLNENIMALRKAKGITQEELAVALGVSNQAVSKWESAQTCPDISLLSVLADYFEVSIDELMGHNIVLKRESSKDDTKEILTKKALSLLQKNGKLYTSLLQRNLSIGYNTAKHLLDNLESEGYIVRDGAHSYVATVKKLKD